MRLHGWCMKCHKVKRVRVTLPKSGIQIGICLDCEEVKREEDPR